MSEIQKTKNYEEFKLCEYNRPVDPFHVRKLKEVLSVDNQLSFHPIIVNEKMEIIDGQHRFVAAKELGLELYYLKGDLDYSHILSTNINQKKLALKDVVKFYAFRDRLPDYIEFYELLGSLGISCKALLGLIFGKSTRQLCDFMKRGTFRMPEDGLLLNNTCTFYKNFLLFVKEKKIRPFSMFTSFHFTSACRCLVKIDEFNSEVFFKKLEFRWFALEPQFNEKRWAQLLIEIYNWHNRSPISYENEA